MVNRRRRYLSQLLITLTPESMSPADTQCVFVLRIGVRHSQFTAPVGRDGLYGMLRRQDEVRHAAKTKTVRHGVVEVLALCEAARLNWCAPVRIPCVRRVSRQGRRPSTNSLEEMLRRPRLPNINGKNVCFVLCTCVLLCTTCAHHISPPAAVRM